MKTIAIPGRNEKTHLRFRQKTRIHPPEISSSFQVTRRVMLVVSKPRNACHHGASKIQPMSLLGCFGFPLSTMFNIPGARTSKPECRHKTGSGLKGCQHHRDRTFDGKWSDHGSPHSTATTSASEAQQSPAFSFVDDCLPELSSEQPQELSISGTLAETLRSVASASRAFRKEHSC